MNSQKGKCRPAYQSLIQMQMANTHQVPLLKEQFLTCKWELSTIPSYSDFRLENWTRGRRPYRLACYKCCTYVYLSECSAYCFYCKNNHSWFRGIYYTITRLCNNWSAILETYNKNNSYNTRFDFQMTYQASKQPRRSLLYSGLIPVASITYAAMSLRPLCNFFQ